MTLFSMSGFLTLYIADLIQYITLVFADSFMSYVLFVVSSVWDFDLHNEEKQISQ